MILKSTSLLIVFFILTQPPGVIYAQTAVQSNPVVTEVGDAPDDQRPNVAGQFPFPAIDPSNLIQTITQQFSLIVRDGSAVWDTQHLQWMFELFYKLAQTTKFFDLVIDGEIIEACNCIPNQLSDYVQMSQVGKYAQKDEFQATLTHELGHSIYHNSPASVNFKFEHANIFSSIREVTTYGAQSESENYAEVIAYCLNRKAVGSVNPSVWQKYYEPLAKKILGSCV